MIRREFPRGAISDGSSFCVTTAVFAWAIDRWLNEGSPFRHLSTNGHSGGATTTNSFKLTPADAHGPVGSR